MFNLDVNKLNSFLRRYLPLRVKKYIRTVPVWLHLWHTIRFVSINSKLKRQLSFFRVKKGNRSIISDAKILIPLVETSHYQYLQILIIAKALQIRGANVKVLICGQFLAGCEIKSVRNSNDKDPCWTCRFNENKVISRFGLEVIRFKDLLSEEDVQSIYKRIENIDFLQPGVIVNDGINLSRCIEDSVTRYFYGGGALGEKRISEVRRQHTITALFALEAAKIIENAWAPDILFSNMNVYSAWEPFYLYQAKLGKKTQTLSMTQFDYNCIRFNQFELFGKNTRFERYKATRSCEKLTKEERDVLSDFVQKRFAGKADIFKDLNMFDSRLEKSVDLKASLDINKNKRNIFVFPNLAWDVGLSDQGGLYSDVVSWVLGTIEKCRLFSNCHLYIKPHPVEVYGVATNKGIVDFVKEKYPELPSNVTIIYPDLKIKTYDLFQFIDLGVIFTGTLGLEMMLYGIPVVSTGMTSHQGLGFASEPQSAGEYLNLLAGLVQTPELDRDELELFAYFYFIRTLIPWKLTKQAYGDDFDGFAFESLDDLLPGRDPYLDHLCTCILDSNNAVPEAWPDV